jgi:hypothetical protein
MYASTAAFVAGQIAEKEAILRPVFETSRTTVSPGLRTIPVRLTAVARLRAIETVSSASVFVNTTYPDALVRVTVCDVAVALRLEAIGVERAIINGG